MPRFLIPFTVFTLIFAGLLYYVLRHDSPFVATNEISLKALAIFFSVLWGTTWSIFSLLIYLMKSLFRRSASFRTLFRPSMRQAAWVAIFIDFLLFFQLLHLFQPLNIALLLFFLLSLELYFGTRQREQKQGK